MKEAFAYVDPSSGFVFLQNNPFLWTWILALLMFFLLPLNFFLKRVRKKIWMGIAVVIILVAIGITLGIMMRRDTYDKKVLILGIDAMDPHITQRLMSKGRLPHFSSLKEEGDFSLLTTTNPPESVVVWSSFSTGLNPGGHGIFDFVMRNPENYAPFLSLSETNYKNGKFRIQTRLKGESFWNILSKNKIPAFVYFCPNTFPPQKIHGRLISGMGLPDLLGMVGKFSFYTTKELQTKDEDSRGWIIEVEPKNDVILTKLNGPKISRNGASIQSEVPLKITLKRQEEKVFIEFQKERFILEKGHWSDWQKVYFKLSAFRKAQGMVRFYLKNITPHFELYLSPVNFDPQRPIFPISYPHNFSRKLAHKIGRFYTQGMPHDAWVLSEERIDEEAFLGHVDIILKEREKILFAELNSFKRGVFFFYFDTLDAIQHMFWRYIDEKHSLYEPSSVYKETIFNYYEKMDRILGEALKAIDKDTILIVVSDHGFGPFRKSVHINRWLIEEDLLFLKSKAVEGREFFEDIDWQKTKAYALGFGGIYINRIGREKYGIVSEAEAEEIKREISERLERLYDPNTGEKVVKNVYSADEIFAGPYINDAPDLFIGFNSGFRASWQTALGGAPKSLFEENKKKWSGGHLVDPGLAKGLIFSSKKIKDEARHIIDIAPTVLSIFNISKPENMQGEELF